MEGVRCPAKGHPGASNPNWKGGVRVNHDGYLEIRAGPLRNVYVHRLVMEAKLGRALLPDEEVHHINGNPLDCRPENLEVKLVEEHRPILNGRPAWGRKP
jgi:hypothetical protein